MATADVVVNGDDGRMPAEAKREPEVNKLFRMVMKHEGSDLHLKVGLSPMMRLRGIIRQMGAPPISKQDMERLVYPIVSEHHRKILEETGGADFDARQGDIRTWFRQIGEDLRSSYELAYVSTNPVRDGSFRKIVIRPKRAGFSVRSKTGYFAR